MHNKTFFLMVAFILVAGVFSGCSSDKKQPMKGDRIAVLEFQGEDQVSSEAKSEPLELAQEKENTAWPQTGGNAAHLPQNLAMNSGKLKKIWDKDIGEGSEKDRKLITVPVSAKDKIFTADTEGKISAFSLDKGKRLWEVNVLPEDDISVTVSAGLTYNNDILYVTDGIGSVIALNAETGKKIWSKTVDQPVRGSPTFQFGRLYMITLNDETLALDALNGDIVWRHAGVQEQAGLLGAPSPAVEGSVVITAYSSGDIVALRSETGQEAWTDNLAGVAQNQSRAVTQLTGFRGSPVLEQNIAYVGNASTRLVAIHVPSGERLWQKEFGVMETPWVSGNMVFAVTSESQLVALTKESGKIRWTVALPRYENPEDKEDPVFWNGPVLAGGRLIVTGSNEKFLEVDPDTGKVLRKNDLPGNVMIPPIVVKKTFIVLTDDGTLAAYR